MSEDINGFDKAYEMDIAGRNARLREQELEKELASSKEYLDVVIQDLSDTKQKLEAANGVINSLQSGILQDEGMPRKQFAPRILWVFLSAIEAVIIIVVLVVYFNNSTLNEQPPEAAAVPTASVDGQSVPASADIFAQQNRTVKLSDSLSDALDSSELSACSPFTFGITERDGMEYLCFSYKDINIYYRNEYVEAEGEPEQRIIIDNGSRLVELPWSYSFEGDIARLCPKIGKYLGNGEEQLMFVSYRQPEDSLPEELEFISVKNLWGYGELKLKSRLREQLEITYTEEHAEGSGGVPLDKLHMTVKDVPYVYLINSQQYTNAVYNGEELIEFDRNSLINFDAEEGITFTAVLSFSDQEYLGEMSGKIKLEGSDVVLDGLKYGAYVQPNQEDPELDGIITPYTKYIEDRVTIIGLNGERFVMEKLTDVGMCTYDWDRLDTKNQNNWIYYDEDGNPASIRGIDVSKYQGEIDWKKVKEAGVEFAVIRLGYRGMNEGTLELDPYYLKNIKGSNDAGIHTGIYFFSQAVNRKEALEEAEMVLDNIKGYKVDYPIVFDTERIAGYDARANGLSRQERTELCIAFCDRIKEAGYTPMIYANTRYMIMGLDITKLQDYDKWFAFYGSDVVFPYEFNMFQYSENGRIPGISGDVDLNISFKDYAAE